MKSLRERVKEIEDDRAWCEYPLDGPLSLMCLAMALLRKLVINFIRSFPHYSSIKYARESFAARPFSVLDLIEMPV